MASQGSAAVANPMRRVLLFALLALVAAPVLGLLVGALAGSAAGWGSGIGLSLPAVFFGATALVA